MMHQHSDIQKLLDRYWEGETTLEEERRLKDLFQSGIFPAEFQREAQLFQVFQAEQAVQLAGSKTVRLPSRRLGWYGLVAAAGLVLLLSAGWWFWQGDSQQALTPPQVVKAVPVEPPLQPTVRENESPPAALVQEPTTKPRKRKPGAAASQTQTIQEDTYETPEQALAEIKAALALVSSKINRSKHEIERGLQEVDKVDILLKNKNG